MTPYYEIKPLGMASSLTTNGADTRVLRPFREVTDLKLPVGASETAVADREWQRFRVPSQEGANRLQDAAAAVPQAAAILDEEMATGMRAAYEARPPGSSPWKPYDSPSAGNTEKWLRDLHNLIDALGDVLPRVQDYVATALDKSASGARSPACESVPVLRPHAAVRAGECARISMKLNNDRVTAAHVALFCTDLFSNSGARILQHQVTFSPSQLQLEPDAYADVALEVAVPLGSRPGAYSGLLMTSGLSYLRAVIVIEVV